MQRSILVGVDAGGSKTVAAAYTLSGELLGLERGPAGNVTVDFSAASDSITNTVAKLLTRLSPDGKDTIPFLCVGAAGATAFGEALLATLREKLAFAGIDKIRVISDALLALYAAHGQNDGVLVISGTGSIAYLRKDTRLRRAGGWGHLLGDEGSGYNIAVSAVRAITKAVDLGVPPPTVLQKAIFEVLQITSLRELIAYVYEHSKRDVAALSDVVMRCAEKKDTTACAILEEAGMRLADLVRTLLLRHDGTFLPLPVACSGGILTGNHYVRTAFESSLRLDTALTGIRIFDVPEPTRGVVPLFSCMKDIESEQTLLMEELL